MKLNQKNATSEATAVLVMTGGFIVESFVANQMAGFLPEGMQKFQGIITTAGGVLVAAMSKDQNVKSAAKGFATGGLKRTVLEFAPENIKATLSLSGLGEVTTDYVIEDYGSEFENYDPIGEAELLGLNEPEEELALL